MTGVQTCALPISTAKELMAKKNDLEKKMSVVEARKIDAEGKVLALSRELEDRGALLAKKDASAKELMAEKADLEKRMNTVAGRAAEAEKALADAAAAARRQKETVTSMAADKEKAVADMESLRKRLSALEAALVAETTTRKAVEGKRDLEIGRAHV